ncbi:IS21 family transposase [Pueribacillus sp. YX66]|uniref:IS21 family transposase n=1 Tax=Pueribacillus sp. YX66 TaxID=3229242 RepID=UPI00358D172C
MDKWEMYMEIHQLLKQGFSKTKVAKKLGISRTTVYRYLKRNPETMSKWIKTTKRRRRKLDVYKNEILGWLRKNPDMTAAQVLDWLQEKYEHLEVAESTVRLYVRELREEYDIPKETVTRDYEAVPETPLGAQIQVDFGETKQHTPDNKTVKLYCISFVLSHSRYKYMEWLDRPFTTRDVIQAHENAFRYYGGIADELVYDQDSLILVSENGGDLILTKEFQAYREERNLIIRMCRKADPESKGKIESVIKYVKKNFAKHRVYHGLDVWNESAWKWLKRTGNYKHHHTTKKRPVEVFALEKQHLRPVSSPIANYLDCDINHDSSITRSVRKDNTIWYQSNRYSVPLGTYNKVKQVYVEEADNELIIKETENGKIIAQHKIESGKGQLVQDTNHLRDRTKGIDTYIETVASYFSDHDKAMNYLQAIRERLPRYTRDQLQMIVNAMKNEEQKQIDLALEECIKRGFYSATEFIDIVQYLNRQRQSNSYSNVAENDEIKPIHPWSESALQTNIQKRDVQEYLAVMEGDVR